MKFRLPFIKLSEHQRFEIKPRYYDAIKEDVAIRKALIKSDLNYQKKGKIDPDRKASIHFERKYDANVKSNKLLFLIIAVLCTIVYIIFN